MAEDFARGRPIAAVERGLAAASLRFGKINRAAEMFENPDRGYANIIEKRITEARGHKLDVFAGRSVGAFVIVGHEETKSWARVCVYD
jgi:hypothetical protein